MKNEKVFSKEGYYHFIVTTNVLTHYHAIETGKQIFQDRLQSKLQGEKIRLLDLACGGEPITISKIVESFPQYQFEYMGIDINPDQVKMANELFQFPGNVIDAQIVEANAWELDLLTPNTYDIVFSGLNFHHAIPEELYYLALQIKKVLKKDGFLLNHDLYRPDDTLYLKRPATNPQNPTESFRLVELDKLAGIAIPDFCFPETSEDWRLQLFDAYSTYLESLNADPAGLAQSRAHMKERDFPVSLKELGTIMEAASYSMEIYDFMETNHPIKEYAAMIVAIPE